MTSLNDRLRGIGEGFGSVLRRTYHYHKHERAKAPFAVWQEGGEPGQVYTDTEKAEQAIEGYLDLYTPDEFDPLIDAFQEKLNETMERWFLSSVTYEDDTNLIHYSWEWTKQ